MDVIQGSMRVCGSGWLVYLSLGKIHCRAMSGCPRPWVLGRNSKTYVWNSPIGTQFKTITNRSSKAADSATTKDRKELSLQQFECFFHEQAFSFGTMHRLYFELSIKVCAPCHSLLGWALMHVDEQRKGLVLFLQRLGAQWITGSCSNPVLGMKLVGSVAKTWKKKSRMGRRLHWPQNYSTEASKQRWEGVQSI